MRAALSEATPATAPAADDRRSDEEPGGDAFIVDVDGWEGPLDVLLALARAQKVDLRQISVVQLADQYLSYVAAARRASLELAAEYLVMAAWLADLKSRLLLPEPAGLEEPSSDEIAAALAFRLRRLDAMRQAGARLMALPRQGRDFWPRGRPEAVEERARAPIRADLRDLLRAYGDHLRRRSRDEPLAFGEPVELETVDAALARIHRSLGQAPGWESLARYLPAGTLEGLRAGDLQARSALAATFGAVLELARQGILVLRQNHSFGPIYLKPSGGPRPEP